jgi:protein tyrosine/serine phosphatase
LACHTDGAVNFPQISGWRGGTVAAAATVLRKADGLMWGLETMDYRWVIGIACVILLPALAIGIFLSTLQLFGNFDEVIPGEYYRAAQPTPAKLAKYVKKYGIKTVLNLRGLNTKYQWYRDEVAEAEKLGVKFVDFKMSARRELTDAQTEQLITLLADLPKPILVHCKSGSDRTGLVSAIYVYKIAGRGEAAAERQISFRYGHIGIPYLSDAFAMDQNWEKLEKRFAGS